jgi:hypothetical protein
LFGPTALVGEKTQNTRRKVMFDYPAMWEKDSHKNPTPRRSTQPPSYYDFAIQGLDMEDEGWSYAAQVEVVPPVSGGSGEAGFKPFLAGVSTCRGYNPKQTARVNCSCCGRSLPAVLTVFTTSWGGGGPQVQFRQLLAICHACRNVSVIAEAVNLNGAWRAVKVGFIPSREETDVP